MTTEKATFGAGCFWGVELEFQNAPGVVATRVGYAGGKIDNPTYKQVCYENTNHAEVVEVEFDPEKTTYEALVRLFFTLHDPTQVNRQGPDVGDQYRTVVFAHSPEQAETARRVKDEVSASGKFRRPVATTIEPAPTFWVAEDYHQSYLAKRGMASCHV